MVETIQYVVKEPQEITYDYKEPEERPYLVSAKKAHIKIEGIENEGELPVIYAKGKVYEGYEKKINFENVKTHWISGQATVGEYDISDLDIVDLTFNVVNADLGIIITATYEKDGE